LHFNILRSCELFSEGYDLISRGRLQDLLSFRNIPMPRSAFCKEIHIQQCYAKVKSTDQVIYRWEDHHKKMSEALVLVPGI